MQNNMKHIKCQTAAAKASKIKSTSNSVPEQLSHRATPSRMRNAAWELQTLAGGPPVSGNNSNQINTNPTYFTENKNYFNISINCP